MTNWINSIASASGWYAKYVLKESYSNQFRRVFYFDVRKTS